MEADEGVLGYVPSYGTLSKDAFGWYGLVTLGTFQPIQAFQLHVQTHTQVAMVIWRSQLTGVNDLVEVKGPDRF